MRRIPSTEMNGRDGERSVCEREREREVREERRVREREDVGRETLMEKEKKREGYRKGKGGKESDVV